jgi:hypothetical protein
MWILPVDERIIDVSVGLPTYNISLKSVYITSIEAVHA